MTPRLHATIMLWSASTDPVRHSIEDTVNRTYAAWRANPDERRLGKRIDDLRDNLNDLANYRCDQALLYDDARRVVGIKPECLPDFREWCARYGFDGGGL